MRTTSIFGIQFIIRMNKVKNNLAPIYSRVTVDGRRVEISLKKWIDPKERNNKKGLAKGIREEVKSLNHYLEEVKSKLMNCYQEMQIHKQLITAEAIKNKFLGSDEKDYTLCKVISYHNSQMKDSLAWGTMKNYFTTQKYIQMFLKVKFGSPDIFLSQLTYKFIVDFEYYLRNYKPLGHHKPLGNNGVMKHIERFRKMINMAVRMEWVGKDPFAKYIQKFDKVNREYRNREYFANLLMMPSRAHILMDGIQRSSKIGFHGHGKRLIGMIPI